MGWAFSGEWAFIRIDTVYYYYYVRPTCHPSVCISIPEQILGGVDVPFRGV